MAHQTTVDAELRQAWRERAQREADYVDASLRAPALFSAASRDAAAERYQHALRQMNAATR